MAGEEHRGEKRLGLPLLLLLGLAPICRFLLAGTVSPGGGSAPTGVSNESNNKKVEPALHGVDRDDDGFIPLSPSLLQRAAADKCWSRQERGRYRARAEFQPSMPLISAIRRYERLHQLCTEAVANWTAVFEGTTEPPSVKLGPSDAPIRCTFVVWTVQGKALSHSLGAQLASLVSGFLYALASDKVFFVDPRAGAQMGALLCNPLPDSSWWSPLSSAQLQTLYEGSPSVDDFKEFMAGNPSAPLHVTFDWGMFKLFCERIQVDLERVTWMAYTTFLYQAPAVFAVPRFRRHMQELFPDNQPFVHLARYLLYPNNEIWARIRYDAEAHFSRADARVGVEIHGTTRKDAQVGNFTDRIHACAARFAELPVVASAEDWKKQLTATTGIASGTAAKLVSLLVTTLNSDVKKYHRALKLLYESRAGGTDIVVAVERGSDERGIEDGSLSQHKRALADLWLLSFSDTLFITFMSPSGHVAAGLAARLPVLVNLVERADIGNVWTSNGAPICERALTLEPCMDLDPATECHGYILGHGNDTRRMPEIQRCRDWRAGVVMYPSPLPSQVEAVVEDGTLKRISLSFP